MRGAVLINLRNYFGWQLMTAADCFAIGYKSGDYTEVVPLLPIPNRIVKYLKADDITSVRK